MGFKSDDQRKAMFAKMQRVRNVQQSHPEEKFTLIVDNGKPWEETLTKSELKKRLKELRVQATEKEDEYPYFEVVVENSAGEELTDDALDSIEFGH